jgi:adenylate cyclase
MFSDLAGSTAYKSQRDQVISLIKTYRHNAEIEEQVEKYRGQVIKSLGDGVLSTFSIEEPEDIALPVNAAIRIQKHFKLLNHGVGDEEKILTRIGISCGSVVDFKSLNPKGKLVNDPQGSTVDLAARLCSLAKATQIVCDSKTSDLLTSQTASRFDVVGPTFRVLKGFAERTPAYVINPIAMLPWMTHPRLSTHLDF